MGRSQQQKGRRGEIELAALLRENGYTVRPGRPVSYGAEPDLVGLNGIHCEVKRHEQLRLSEWMKQAVEDSERFGDGLPVVFHRRNREEWQVTMRLSDWMKLYQGDKWKEVVRCDHFWTDTGYQEIGGTDYDEQ